MNMPQPGQVIAPGGPSQPAASPIAYAVPQPAPAVQLPVRSAYLFRRIGRLAMMHEVAAARRPDHKSGGFFTLRGQLRSLAVGLGCGLAVLLLFGFALFNELVITPFIRPAATTVKVPAADQAGVPVDPSPKIRIPKINVEIPVVYGVTSTDEKQFQLALDEGVAHYPTTKLPGQAGNAAFFGHSSNNIFNPGKYKFAFVLLHELVVGDKFYITYEGKLYTYEIISRQVVRPTEVGVLNDIPGQAATATLVTCDPPGTSNNRLVVVGKQVGPAPDDSVVPAVAEPQTAELPVDGSLPGNGPGLLSRLLDSIF